MERKEHTNEFSGGFVSRKQRARILIGFLGILILVLSLRLFFLQVIKASYYKLISEENRIHAVPLPAPRGTIKDRNGKIIAFNRPSYTIFLIPYEAKDLDLLSQRLAPILNMDLSWLKEKLKANWSKKYERIKLKKEVDFKTICVIEEQNQDLPGVIYQVEQTRSYPEGSWAGHVLGYIKELSKQELSTVSTSSGEESSLDDSASIKPSPSENRGYRLGGYIGRVGVEKQYDDLLRGKDGMTFLEVTASGKILGPLEDREPDLPTKGADMKLTIDLDLQAEAESALATYESGAVVALDPKNGEILTLVSKPGFDANLLSGALSPDEWKEISQNPLHPFLSRTIQATYAPGSTLKLLTAGAALESKVAHRDTYLSPCFGFYQFGSRAFRCWRPEGHGRLNFMQAIVQSCDVYFYQLGLKVGLERWSHYAKLCGFGEQMGVDLPEEAKGFIPSPEYYNKKYGKGEWVKNLVINLAIGQGEVLVTPLQLASFYCGLATDGTIYRPHILKEITTTDGRVITTQSEVLRRLPFSASTLELLKEAMIGVVNDASGTGGLARISVENPARGGDITVAGKTGTAQNPFGEAHAWFVGYAPAENPKIVVAVLVENAGHGGTFAAPVVKAIISKYLKREVVAEKTDSTVAVGSPSQTGLYDFGN
jgi:penicillin-binding protein 2